MNYRFQNKHCALRYVTLVAKSAFTAHFSNIVDTGKRKIEVHNFSFIPIMQTHCYGSVFDISLVFSSRDLYHFKPNTGISICTVLPTQGS